MERPGFVIEASEAGSMAEESGLASVPHLLPSLVASARTLARVPISAFPVGVVGLDADGRIFVGVNLEFPGLPLHHSVHAEQFLITNLALHGSPGLRYIAVSSAPCGHCRQFFQEIRDGTDIAVLVTGPSSAPAPAPSAVEFRPLSHLLPQRFGPDDLLDERVPLLLEPHRNGLVFQEHQTHGGGKLAAAALEAANESHAPYSGCPSGIALQDREGKVYRGSYVESAAYNPSLGPVQAALVAYIVGGGGEYGNIAAAALVEKKGAKVAQERTAHLILQMISPSCDLRVFHCSTAPDG